MGEGEAGTKGEGLVLELVNQQSAAATGNDLFWTARHPTVWPCWFEPYQSLFDHCHGAIGESVDAAIRHRIHVNDVVTISIRIECFCHLRAKLCNV